jgi:acetyl esterase
VAILLIWYFYLTSVTGIKKVGLELWEGGVPQVGQSECVDLDAQQVLDLVAASGRPPMEEAGVAAAREAMRGARLQLGAPPVTTWVQDLVAPGAAGPIPIRLYRPPDTPAGRLLPLLVYYHGGGWVLGDIETGDAFCTALAVRVGIAVAAVDYRLAPEHPFPAAVEDSVHALTWLASEAKALGLRHDRIAVAGDSAGGNLAAVCALTAQNAGGLALRAQILLYPVTDMTMTSDSYERNASGYLLGAATMRWFRSLYLGEEDPGDWRASPLKAPRLDGLPPALVVTCGFDPLHDEGLAFAERLRAAGVPTRYYAYPNQIHGFALWGKLVRDAETVLSQVAEELTERLFPTGKGQA